MKKIKPHIKKINHDTWMSYLRGDHVIVIGYGSSPFSSFVDLLDELGHRDSYSYTGYLEEDIMEWFYNFEWEDYI